MRIKLILALGIVIAFLLLNQFHSAKNSESSTISNKTETSNLSIGPIKENKKTTSKTVKAIQKDRAKKTNSIEVVEPIYSPDPVVNANAVFKKNQLCYSQLENSKSPSIYLQQFLDRLDEKQAQFFEDFLEHCRKLDKKHPEYFLSNKEEFIKKLKKSKPNSLWGKILNREIDVEDLTPVEVQSLIKSNDINILQEAPEYFKSYYQEVIHWGLESFLGNHDYDYVTYIRRYAHQLYLCNLGDECDSNSTVMAGLCFRDEFACGIDYISYVNNFLTSGQQADIQLALSYLQNQYQ